MTRTAKIIIVAVVAAAAGLAGWSNRDRIAVRLAPAKRAATTRSAAAIEADSVFWRIFHGAAYDSIPRTLEVLTAAYLETPSDAVTAAHIAWLHNWRMAERIRLAESSASITDHGMLARRYFEEAAKLNPSDARVQGFLAGHLLLEGNLHQDERLTRRGYFMMRDAIEAWPEFNLFTAGYVMSRLPVDNPRYREGLEWEWRNLDVCAGERVDRVNPDFSRYMAMETREGPRRACWNSWIAPHNFEGFFLNLGDMLVKAGDWQTAQKVYDNAKHAREYSTWPFAALLDERIAQARENVASFNGAPGAPVRPIMINSAAACAGCHQR